jgi:hypothetical protein
MINITSDKLIYSQIKEILTAARAKAYSAINFAMVDAYWLIGKQIVEAQGNNERAEYGTSLLKYLSERLTQEFGKGFDESNLRLIRQFYLIFPIRDAVRHELSWTHYRLIMKVNNETSRNFYIDECIKSNWSTRQLERQINTLFYERLLSSQNKEAVAAEIQKTAPVPQPRDFIKSPCVLEFLMSNLRPNSMKKILRQQSSNIYSRFCWKWVAAFRLWRDKNVSLLTGAISTLIWYSITIF